MNRSLPKHTMTTGDVARVLGVSSERVRQLENKLKPAYLPNGQRRYDRTLVERLLAERSR